MLEEEGQLEKVANSAKNAGPDNGAKPFDSRDLAITRAKVSEARHLPGYFYTSHEIYEQEKEMLFMRDGLAAGRVSTKTRC